MGKAIGFAGLEVSDFGDDAGVEGVAGSAAAKARNTACVLRERSVALIFAPRPIA